MSGRHREPLRQPPGLKRRSVFAMSAGSGIAALLSGCAAPVRGTPVPAARSTGALIAPFAFLGSSYDPQLRYVFTGHTPTDVLTSRFFSAAIFDDAMADNAPLMKTLSTYVNETMLADIAAAYNSGRLLLLGT